jgi:integrase
VTATRRSHASHDAPGPQRSGEVREYVTADGSVTYSVRIRWQGQRLIVRLGNELDGWNRRLAQVKLTRILEEIESGTWRPPVDDLTDADRDPTLHEFATVWLDRKRADVDEGTYADYSHTLSRYILPEFKEHRLTEITYEATVRWRERLQAEAAHLQMAKREGVAIVDRHGKAKRTYGARTINEALRLLGQILGRAVESEHFLIERNPVQGRSGLRLRTPPRPPREHLEADEVVSLIRVADFVDQRVNPESAERALQVRQMRAAGSAWGEIAQRLSCAESTAIYLSHIRGNPDAPRRMRAMIVVLALSGLRASELTDLLWGDIDHTHGRIVLAKAKTPAGIREIHLSPFVREELELYRNSLTTQPDPSHHVFRVRGGGPYDRHNVGRRLKHLAELATERRARAGHAPLPARVIPHTFRRTAITLAIQAGKDLVFVQTQAGHADWKTTLEIYTQFSRRSVEPGIRRLLEEMLGDEPASDLEPSSSLHLRERI